LKDSQKSPKVSFAIPTLNSERTIGPCLDSIIKQNYPDFEIVIVDGGSYDSTVEISSKYTSKIFFDNGPLGHARQTGADNSTGEVLAIFDSDIVLPSVNWLRKAVQQFSRRSNVGVIWPINRAPQNASIVSRCYFNFWNKRLEETPGAIPGGNSLILRKAFDQVNGFNTCLHYGEDMDLVHRIICRGYHVVIFGSPVIHDSMHTLASFTRKQVWGAHALLDSPQTDFTLLYKCAMWKSTEENDISLRYALKSVLLKQVCSSLRWMTKGLIKDKDYSWVALPLLLYIRAQIYGIFFLKNMIKIF